MKRLAEIAVFVALAVGLHLALLMRMPGDEGEEAGGQGGQAMVSLQGAAPGVEAMVQKWETPPDVTEAAEAPEQPVTPPSPPVATPQADTPPVTMPKMELAAQTPDTLALPKMDTEVPPPPKKPEPKKPEPEVAKEQPSETAPEEARRPMTRPADLKPEPAPKKAQPADHTQQARKGGDGGATQRAAGRGGSAQAGNASGKIRSGQGHNPRAEAVWGARIRAWIERKKRFPGSMRGQEGRVVLRLTVARDGRLLAAKVVRSSGHAAFDQAAMTAVKRAGRMPAAPSELTNSQYSFNLPVDFS